jgi:2'-5' RNA ligase
LQRQLPPRIVRWTNPDGIHLTLKFLGDTAEALVPAISQGVQVAAASFGPFDLRVAGFGCFPTPRKARVLWVGVPDIPQPLAGIQRAIDLHMARLDFPRETRSFSPHLTLGRVNDHISPAERATLAGVLAQTQAGDLGAMAVSEIILFKSDLQPGGAVYTALARSRLERAAR